MERFKDAIKNPLIGASDWFNHFGSFLSIFDGAKHINILTDMQVGNDPLHYMKPSFLLDGINVKVVADNSYDLAHPMTITKFMALTCIRFKNDQQVARSYVELELMKREINYIRVGTDYFKIINKQDRWGSTHRILKSWTKEELRDDHGKNATKSVPKYDDFTIHPSNKEFTPVINNCYNLYSKFVHKPAEALVRDSDLLATSKMLLHIFGDQLELGLQYMKILYENPTQILPVLSLVSKERDTGKTTFLNWIQIIFGQNSVLISPDDLHNAFNATYATKNIILIDETEINKSASVEKLKSLATAKSLSVSQKFVQQYSVPFFGKIIICTNKETDFMRIDEEEIRFWVRKLKPIESADRNVNIENDLWKEIPYFLKAIEQMKPVDLTKSRMVFTKEQISTTSLNDIKSESRSGLYKEIEILIQDWFNENNNIEYIEVSATDIKNKWFYNDRQTSIYYLRKVIKDEMKISLSKVKKYHPWGLETEYKTSMVFEFKNPNFNPSVEIF